MTTAIEIAVSVLWLLVIFVLTSVGRLLESKGDYWYARREHEIEEAERTRESAKLLRYERTGDPQ